MGYFSTSLLEEFECFLDQIAQRELLALAVINEITDVLVVILVQVEDWQYLTIVWHLQSVIQISNG